MPRSVSCVAASLTDAELMTACVGLAAAMAGRGNAKDAAIRAARTAERARWLFCFNLVSRLRAAPLRHERPSLRLGVRVGKVIVSPGPVNAAAQCGIFSFAAGATAIPWSAAGPKTECFARAYTSRLHQPVRKRPRLPSGHRRTARRTPDARRSLQI